MFIFMKVGCFIRKRKPRHDHCLIMEDAALKEEGWHLQSVVVENLRKQMEGCVDLLAMIRTELLDIDLKQVGTPSLPLRHRLIGRLVLQVVKIEDIGESRETGVGNRMLRIHLTDGHYTMTSIEYKHVPILSLDIPPGTKVVLDGLKMKNGIGFLDSHSIQVLGGHVKPLCDAWEVEHKQSWLARKTLSKGATMTDSSGPPQFRVLHVDKMPEDANASLMQYKLHSQSSNPQCGQESTESHGLAPESLMHYQNHASIGEDSLKKDEPSAPIKNREAAQKLLEVMIDVKQSGSEVKAKRAFARTSRQGRGRGRDTGECHTLTLDEWEARNRCLPSVANDEIFARELQNQLMLEDDQADQLRLSMFNYAGDGHVGENTKPRGPCLDGRRFVVTSNIGPWICHVVGYVAVICWEDGKDIVRLEGATVRVKPDSSSVFLRTAVAIDLGDLPYSHPACLGDLRHAPLRLCEIIILATRHSS